MSFSPSSFLANFSAASQTIDCHQKDAARRTQTSLVDLFHRESEHGQQFDHYFDQCFNHCVRWWYTRLRLTLIRTIPCVHAQVWPVHAMPCVPERHAHGD